MATAIPLQADLEQEEVVAEEVQTGAEESTLNKDENEWSDLLSEEGSEEEALITEGDEQPAVEGDTEVKPAEEKPEETSDETLEGKTEEELKAEEEAKKPKPEGEEKPAVIEEETKPAEEVTQALEEARVKARDQLKEKFALTEEQEDLLIQSPNKVLPELAANLYLDLFDSIMGGFQQQLPGLIRQVIQTDQVQQKQENAFFEAWPQLNKPDYQETVQRIAQSYRALNPQTSEEEAIKEIGAQAWVALRLPLEELAQVAQGGVVETAAPRQPATRRGAAEAVPRKPKPDNAFTQLANELIEEDDL